MKILKRKCKLEKFALITFIIIIFFSLLTFASAENVFVDTKVIEDFKNSSYSDVIIIFKDESLNSFIKENPKKENLKILEQKSLTYKKTKKDILKSFNNNIKVEKDFSIIPGFSTKVSKEDFDQLRNNKNVKGIYKDELLKIFRTDSIPKINANIVHDLTIKGQNIKGNNETICIIDTGVYSSHQELQGKIIQEKCYCSESDYWN